MQIIAAMQSAVFAGNQMNQPTICVYTHTPHTPTHAHTSQCCIADIQRQVPPQTHTHTQPPEQDTKQPASERRLPLSLSLSLCVVASYKKKTGHLNKVAGDAGHGDELPRGRGGHDHLLLLLLGGGARRGGLHPLGIVRPAYFEAGRGRRGEGGPMGGTTRGRG